MWDHTVLPATRHKWTNPVLTPARQAGTRFTYRGEMEVWVDLGRTAKNAASGIAVVTWPRHPWPFQTRKFRRFSFSLWVVAERYILQQQCLKKWIGSALLGTRRYNVQPLSVSITIHFIRQTDRRQYHANSRSYWVQQYDRLKIIARSSVHWSRGLTNKVYV